MARVGRILETDSATHTVPLGQQLQVIVDLDATAVEVAPGRLAQLRQQCQESHGQSGSQLSIIPFPFSSGSVPAARMGRPEFTEPGRDH